MSLGNMKGFEPRTLKGNVTEILRRSIIEGDLAPGIEFNQTQIAERLGISRGPLREALAQLEQEGLVESTPYKGVVVTRLTRRYIAELYSVRTTLETLAVERAIDRMTPKHLEMLHRIVDEMRQCVEDDDSTALLDLDLAFHEQLLLMADHRLAFRLWKVVEVGVRRALRISHKIYTLLDEVVGTHPTLITALEARDKALATRLLHEHIAESMNNIVANLPVDSEADQLRDARPTSPSALLAELLD